jgi:hypothetical protein
LPKPRDQPSIKKLRGCDGMHEIRTLLSERMREVRAALGAHARGKTQAAEELGVVMITRMRPKTVMFGGVAYVREKLHQQIAARLKSGGRDE